MLRSSAARFRGDFFGRHFFFGHEFFFWGHFFGRDFDAAGFFFRDDFFGGARFGGDGRGVRAFATFFEAVDGGLLLEFFDRRDRLL